MKFRSNSCIAIHLTSLAKAEQIYRDVLGFKLKKQDKDLPRIRHRAFSALSQQDEQGAASDSFL